ncbi:MGA protein, partial [Picathartes gymnocephalus]|nr:MGA protein [Picathartes gymnocephalus]
QSTCSLRGCCWSPQSDTSVPWCFFSPRHGYRVQGSQRSTQSGKLGLGPPNSHPPWTSHPTQHLAFVSQGFEATLQRLPSPSLFGSDIHTVLLTAEYQTPHRFRFKITDPKARRFEVPHEHVRPFTGSAASGLGYKVEL